MCLTKNLKRLMNKKREVNPLFFCALNRLFKIIILRGGLMLKKMTAFFVFIYVFLVFSPVALQKKEADEPVFKLAEKEAYDYEFDELEDYVTGVVAAEMPAEFEEEALKAQAVCARTYAIRNMEEAGTAEIPYDIYQAYCTKEEMKAKWGDDFDKYYGKVYDAVLSTKGEIMIYENEPVLAVFHSMSGGMTEMSENVWGGEVPYLKSVDSSFDEASTDFICEAKFGYDEVKNKLKEKYGDIAFEGDFFEITKRSEAGYVMAVSVGSRVFTGKEIREALGLRSANFTVKKDGNTVTFITKGFGHGAGLSQYGANHMAKSGKSYIEILKHYYTGIEMARLKTNFEG